MLQRRNIKLDRANKSILLRALGNVYYAQKATGSDCTATGALVLRIHALPPKGGRLALDMDEYRLATWRAVCPPGCAAARSRPLPGP